MDIEHSTRKTGTYRIGSDQLIYQPLLTYILNCWTLSTIYFAEGILIYQKFPCRWKKRMAMFHHICIV